VVADVARHVNSGTPITGASTELQIPPKETNLGLGSAIVSQASQLGQRRLTVSIGIPEKRSLLLLWIHTLPIWQQAGAFRELIWALTTRRDCIHVLIRTRRHGISWLSMVIHIYFATNNHGSAWLLQKIHKMSMANSVIPRIAIQIGSVSIGS